MNPVLYCFIVSAVAALIGMYCSIPCLRIAHREKDPLEPMWIMTVGVTTICFVVSCIGIYLTYEAPLAIRAPAIVPVV